MLCSCLVPNERIHFYQVSRSNGHFAFSAGICYSTNLKDKLQTQHEVCRVKAVPYGVTWTACQNLSPQPVSFTLWQSTTSSQEVNWRRRGKERWNSFKCSNDWRWHLTDDFNVKTVLQGNFLTWCVTCKLNPKVHVHHLLILWEADTLSIEQQVWVNCVRRSCNLFSWTKSSR